MTLGLFAPAAVALTLALAAAPVRAESAPPATAIAPAAGSAAPAPAPPPTGPAAPATALPPARANRRPDAVDITLVGSAPTYDGLRARIGERTAIGVPLLWSRIDRFNPLTEMLRGAPPPRASALRCWIDLTDLRHATLYFADPGGERFLVRELPLSGRFDEVDQQALAQVVELSISALVENEAIGFSRTQAREMFARAQPPPSAAAAAPPAAGLAATAPAPQTRRWRLDPGLFYAVEEVGAALPLAQGPGLILALASTGAAIRRPGLGLRVAAQYQLPIEARQPDVGVRLQAISARIGVDARWGRLQARLGAGASWTHVTPLPGAGQSTAVLAAPHWSQSWIASGAVAAQLPLEQALRNLIALSVVLFLDAIPSVTQYQLQQAGGSGSSSQVAFTAAPVSPRPGARARVLKKGAARRGSGAVGIAPGRS